MTNAGEEYYSKTYVKLVKKESADKSEEADINRKLLLLTREESTKTLDNKSTSLLCEKSIQRYVESTSNGRIFAEKLTATNNSSKWKSNLRNDKALSQFFKTNTIKSSSADNEYKVLHGVFNTKSDYVPHSKPNVNTRYVNPYSNPSTSKESHTTHLNPLTSKENIQTKNTENVVNSSSGKNLPGRPNFDFGGNQNVMGNANFTSSSRNINAQNPTNFDFGNANFTSLSRNINVQNPVRSNIQLKQITPVNPEYGAKPKDEDKTNKFVFKKWQPSKTHNYNKNEDNVEDKKKDIRSYGERFKAIKEPEGDDDDGEDDFKNPYCKKNKAVNMYKKRFKKREDDEDEDVDDKFKYKKKDMRSYGVRFKGNKDTEDDDDCEDDFKSSYAKKKKAMDMYRKRFKKQEDDEEEEAPKKCEVPAFKTAREELIIQHTKKHGANAPLASSLKRKRLGLGGPCGKFISPMINRNESKGADSPKSQEDPEQILDERLKNIDPKMVDLIKSEIMESGPKIDWNDIAGLEFAKTAIQEAVIWPMLRPDIFTGLRRPPKGILLFGPPGTGKTLIGKCVASQSQSTFFSISASSLTSKWIGDGEKMVRALFAVARCHQPAVIFIDEIDSLLSQRSDSEHESSRRIKTEFLVQLDGATTDNEERLLLIAATNRPQELDEAARRRFVKRLYIPLPELEARLQLVQHLMASEKHSLVESNIKEIATLSDGYSGADMRNLCADACMGPVRSIDISQIENIQAQEVRPVSMEDFTKSLSRVRSSVSSKDLDQYISWDKTYGSGAF